MGDGKIKKLFNYCVYRVAYTVKRETGYPLYMNSANFKVCAAVTAYILSLIHIVLFFFQINLRFLYSFCAFIVISIALHLITDKNVVEAEAMYKRYLSRKEKNRWRNGLLVFLFLLFSLVSYIGTAIIAFNKL